MCVSEMNVGVAEGAEGDQVFFGVVARVAAKLLVMNLQVRHRAAGLTPPAIAAKHLVAELFVRIEVQPQAWEL